ncbi:MAG: NYN domain-containing protein [Patescibacteria group bacterium]
MKIAIFIDGNNFYKGLEGSPFYKEEKKDLELFNYDKLAKLLAVDREILVKKYYKGVIRKEPGNLKSAGMVSKQQSLFSRLQNNDWDIGRGKMSKASMSGKCQGFCILEEEIRDKKEFKEHSKEILKNNKFCYNPIVVISKDFSKLEELKEVIQSITKVGGVQRSKGLYFTLNTWNEKGVDVRIAIDMLEIAYAHKFSGSDLDTIILISNDSDFKPVIQKVQSLGISVEYVGFDHSFSVALLNVANKRLLLTREQLEQCFPATTV